MKFEGRFHIGYRYGLTTLTSQFALSGMVWGVGVGSGRVLVYAVCCATVGARARVAGVSGRGIVSGYGGLSLGAWAVVLGLGGFVQAGLGLGWEGFWVEAWGFWGGGFGVWGGTGRVCGVVLRVFRVGGLCQGMGG